VEYSVAFNMLWAGHGIIAETRVALQTLLFGALNIYSLKKRETLHAWTAFSRHTHPQVLSVTECAPTPVDA